MNRTFVKTTAAMALVATAALAGQTQTAAADDGWKIAAGVAGGLAAGAIIGSALSQPRYAAPPVYYAPRRVYRPSTVVTYRPAPWSPAWYNYCRSKYRSFNPQTGYFLAYSGQYRFCR